MNASTIKALAMLHKNWLEQGDGPLITMDAGSNIHLLFRPDQKSLYFQSIDIFRPELSLWTDEGYLQKL
jgi:diphosphomevalonate decarboxylase